MKVEDITTVALNLPSDARALLAERLFESLDLGEEGSFHNQWAEEASRRLDELRSGKVQAIDGEEVFRKMRLKYSE